MFDRLSSEPGSDAEDYEVGNHTEKSALQFDNAEREQNILTDSELWVKQSEYESDRFGDGDKEIELIETEIAGQYDLSEFEIARIKNDLGLEKKLNSLSKKARELFKEFKHKVGDIKSSYVMNYGKFNDIYNLTPLGKRVLKSMSDEDVLHHPEILDVAVQEINRTLKKALEKSNDRDSYNMAIDDHPFFYIEKLFDKHPKSLDRIFSDPKIQELQKEALPQFLYGSHRNLAYFLKNLRVRPEFAKEVIFDICGERYNTESPFYKKRIEDSERMFPSLSIDFKDSRVQDLALKEMLLSMETNSTDFIWHAVNYYGFSYSEVEEYVKQHSKEFQQPVLDMLEREIDKYHTSRLLFDIYEEFIKKIERYSGLDMKEIVSMLSEKSQQKLRQSFYENAERPIPDEITLLLFGQTYQELINSPETKKILFDAWRKELGESNTNNASWRIKDTIKEMDITMDEFINDSVDFYLAQDSLKGIHALINLTQSLRNQLPVEVKQRLSGLLLERANAISSEEFSDFFDCLCVLDRSDSFEAYSVLLKREDITSSVERSNSIIQFTAHYGMVHDTDFIINRIDDFDKNTMSAVTSKMHLLKLSDSPEMQELLIDRIEKEQWFDLLPSIVDNALRNERSINVDIVKQAVASDPVRLAKLFDVGFSSIGFVLLKELVPILLNKVKELDEITLYRSLLMRVLTAKEDYEIPESMKNYLESMKDLDIRSQQLEWGTLISAVVSNNRYESLVHSLEVYGVDTEKATETAEGIKKFTDQFPISEKGLTIAVLTSMAEYQEGENLVELLDRLNKQLQEWQEVLDTFSPSRIPEGVRTSIGMEYEIMYNTGNGYAEQYGRDLSSDLDRATRDAKIKRGNDGVFEIATNPTDNPFLLLIEMQLLQQLDYIDFNFNKSDDYMRGARGYHLTVGGENGLYVGENINFLQNNLIISGWGGINAGKNVTELAKARSNIRQRGSYVDHNVKLFENATPSVELRSLSLDTWEPFERSILTSYYGAMAVQTVELYSRLDHEELLEISKQGLPSTSKQLGALLQEKKLLTKDVTPDLVLDIMYEWIKLQTSVLGDIEDHNKNFVENETTGYMNAKGIWVEASDFGGQNNYERFMGQLDGNESLDNIMDEISIEPEKLFSEADPKLANKCTKITNLFLKTDDSSKGDIVNALSVLDTTKIGMVNEDADVRAKYQSVVETGQERKGYYYMQGGSEKMLIHAIQKRLLEFKQNMQQLTS